MSSKKIRSFNLEGSVTAELIRLHFAANASRQGFSTGLE